MAIVIGKFPFVAAKEKSKMSFRLYEPLEVTQSIRRPLGKSKRGAGVRI
jgi:hypothetical protein